MRPETIGLLPAFPYGAVYFRKSNPPRQDWQEDYRVAAEDGMNMFRHWFMWSAIETAPGRYDWDDYDRQLDLAQENGLKTMIAEMITAAPEWAFRQYSHARFETAEGARIGSQMSGSSATGGFPGLCLDNEDVKDIAGRFLQELVSRYQHHPALTGYDIWNECNFREEVCYCPATADRFRAWLKDRYGDVKTLGEAWYRNSYSHWEDIEPPSYGGPYPDFLDWLEFRIDNAYRLMRWRVETIRSVDQDHIVAAHGLAAALDRMATGGADDWRAASEVEVYGLTWIASRKGDEPWKQWHAVDLTRASSRGKPFWHAEAQAGPLWMQPQVVGRPLEDGRIATHPIAGTRPRGKDPTEDKAFEEELVSNEKERAEHIMLVDLARNDVGRVSQIGSVHVPRLMGVDRYSHVMHLVSRVEGLLRPDYTIFDAMRACFPAGTLSGAPKIRAMEIISEMEGEQRGPYSGAVGYFSYGGNTDTALTIRTLVYKDGLAHIQAGGGIVSDSIPLAEYEETLHKAGALLRAIEAAEIGEL